MMITNKTGRHEIARWNHMYRWREAQSEKITEYQRRCRAAAYERRQEVARQRRDAGLKQAANRERVSGKGLFYCTCPVERMRELQLRDNEAAGGKLAKG